MLFYIDLSIVNVMLSYFYIYLLCVSLGLAMIFHLKAYKLEHILIVYILSSVKYFFCALLQVLLVKYNAF